VKKHRDFPYLPLDGVHRPLDSSLISHITLIIECRFTAVHDFLRDDFLIRWLNVDANHSRVEVGELLSQFSAKSSGSSYNLIRKLGGLDSSLLEIVGDFKQMCVKCFSEICWRFQTKDKLLSSRIHSKDLSSILSVHLQL
jgi:hypothetical protein